MNKNKIYIRPNVEMLFIDLEESIATGSAKVNPGNESQQVLEEWTDGPTDYREVEW